MNKLSSNSLGRIHAIDLGRDSYPGSQKSIDHFTNGSSSSYESLRNLNLSDEKLANIKSPIYQQLNAMISTLGKFREEMDGTRVPKYELAFLARKKKEQKIKRRIEQQERKQQNALEEAEKVAE